MAAPAGAPRATVAGGLFVRAVVWLLAGLLVAVGCAIVSAALGGLALGLGAGAIVLGAWCAATVLLAGGTQ